MEESSSQVTPEHWQRNYAPMWVGQAVSMLGSGLVQFALVWYLTERTGSATILAMATFVALIPRVILGPFAGALVDRLNRKMIMIVSDLAVALATVGLVILFALGLTQTWHIYLAMFIRSLCGAFQYPAMEASTTLMVPADKYAKLGGINQALNGSINIVSPPLGALFISIMPMQSVLAIDLITAALAIALLVFFVKVPQPILSDGNVSVTPKRVWLDVREGLKYAVSWPGMIKLLLTATLLNMLFSPAFSLMPLLVTQHFGKGASELAWLESALGIGIVVGGLILGTWGGFKRKVTTILIGLIGMGVGIAVIGVVPASGYGVTVGMMGLVGMMNALTNGPLGALLQTKIPAEKQGRIFTVVESLASAASPLGMLLAAPVAERLGIQAWYLLAGAISLAMGVAGFFMKDVYTLDDQAPGGMLLSATEAENEQPACNIE